MIGVAVVGAGLMGSLHARNFAGFRDRVRVRYVCDAEPARAAALAAEVGAEAVELDAALADPAVGAVAIAVPPDLNRALAERALGAGKHVFLEKPIALTREDADAIVAAAERSGRVLMIGLVLRFWSGYRELQRLVVGGELGRPVTVAAYRLQRAPDWSPWISDPSRSGGIAPLVLVHDFDQANWLLGRPRRVHVHALQGSGAGASHVVALVEHEGGSAVAEASTSLPRSFPFSSGIRVVCERGAVEYRMEVEAPRDEGAGADRFTPVEPPALRVFPAEADAPRLVPLDDADVWVPELAHFLDCVERGREPEQGTAAQAREALLVALAANRSLESGRAEDVYD